MRLKKILSISIIAVLVSTPFLGLTFVNLFPKKDSIDSRYLIQDNMSIERKKDLKKALDDTIKNDNLIFKFYSLTRTNEYTPSMLSWFTEFDKALKALDHRLGFELIPRTNQTVETGFRQKNGEMISMFWSPDYHNIGTWIGFHFQPNYQTANLWPSLWNYMHSNEGTLPTDINSQKFGPLESNFMPSKWADSLIKHLELAKYPKDGNPNAEYLFKSNDELIELDKKITQNGIISQYSKTGAREAIANEISLWADINNEMALGLINWIDHQNVALPWITNGPSSTMKFLVRNGYNTPKNVYSGESFREWFYNPEIVTNIEKPFIWWNANDPFSSNRTPYNPSFNDSSNNMFFQSTYNALVDWKIVDDWQFDDETQIWIPPKATFFLNGAETIRLSNSSSPIDAFKLTKGSLTNSVEIPIDDIAYKNALLDYDVYDFTITPFPWLNSKGEEVGILKSQDFFWGLMGYKLSVDLGLNTNGYYIDLMNIDMEATIKANPSFYSKDSNGNYIPKESEELNLRIVLTQPNVNFLDMLSKQFFQPLPIQNEKVKNIFKIPGNKDFFNDKGEFQVNNVDFNTLYGAGEKKSNFSDWWSAGPYYVSQVSEQDIQFWINEKYFNIMTKNNTIPVFKSFNKIKKIVMKYAGAYSPQVTYEQFKSDEIDKSEIPSALIVEAYNAFKQDFRTEGVSIVPRTDLIPYNINIYENDDSGFLIPKEDKNGNKKIKSLISPQYEKAIVRDFSQGESGNSWKIRNAITQSINWYSLSALATPDGAPSYQQSVVPFGNYRASVGNITSLAAPFINKTTYWETAAYNKEIGFLRRPIEDYIENWKSQFKEQNKN